MSFRIEYGDSIIKPLFTQTLNITGTTNSLSALTNLLDYTAYYALADSNLIVSDQNGFINEINSFSRFKPAGQVQTAFHYVYGVLDSTLSVTIKAADTVLNSSKDIGEVITAPPVIIREGDMKELLLATYEGRLLYYEISSNPSTPVLEKVIEINPRIVAEQIAAEGDFYAILGKLITPELVDYWFYVDNLGSYEFVNEFPINILLTKDSKGSFLSVITTSSKNIYGIRGSEILFEFSLITSVDIKSIALTDLKQDGTNYIVLNNGNNIEVYNLTGSMADNFPFPDPEGIGFIGTPLTADFEGDSKSEIISVTKDGRIFAIDGGTGKVVPGFPISVGATVSVTPVLYNANGKTNLAVINDQNVLSAWSISSIEGKLYWSEEFGNPQNTSFIDAAENTNRINEFFPTDRAYNYPNPVYGGETNIRYYVSEDSKINIKIFDLAGDYVAELNDDAAGGLDNETIWNVTNIQSGVYLARIEAVSTSGNSEFAIIKIAVVK